MANDRHDEWIRLYVEEELSAGKIAARFEVTEAAVLAVLRKRNVPRRRPNYNQLGEQLQEHYPKWAELYRSGRDLKQIGDAFGVTKMTVARGLGKMGIDRRQSQELNKKYRVRNANAFDVIDSEEKAYFLGLLMADGNVMVGFAGERSAKVSLALQQDDRCLVEAFALFTGTEAPVHDKHFKERPGYGESFQVELHIHDRTLADSLIRCGCVPRKTLTLQYPTQQIVPDELQGAFVRGYFDGNGCISGRKNRNGITMTVAMGSQAFALGLCAALARHGMVMRVRAYKNAKAFIVTTESVLCVKSFYRFMYDAATVWLPRKRHKFEELLGLTGSAN